MAQSAPFRDGAVSPALPAEGVHVPKGVWGKLKLIAARSVFWSYERGSWQYDVICAVILAFIFITPSSWFHDHPTLGLTNLRHTQGVIELGSAPDGLHYLVDARLVSSSLFPSRPNDAIRQILQRRLHRPVKLKTVAILRDRNNVVLGYTVVLQR
jgi:hypothetical protein